MAESATVPSFQPAPPRPPPLRRVAVLNRGEPAVRFLRALADYNGERGTAIEAVAFYTDPDVGAPFVRLADAAICLGPALQPGADGVVVSAYLRHQAVLTALQAAGCDAVWPGWGFCSEDARFVGLLEAAGVRFLGPSSAAMLALGDKIESKRLAEQAGVPLAAWWEVPESATPEEIRVAAERIGLPLMVKASAGGGGRGIRKVSSWDALDGAIASARDEVRKIFGAGGLFLEACVLAARHVEVQLLGGADGKATAVGVRDCSLQRRNQKVLEEAPAPILPPAVEAEICAASVRLAELAGYRGAGTAEFLYTAADRRACFLEVNSRLQVEHTVTECVTGVDLVHAQIDIARGLPWQGQGSPSRGFAIEVRLNAEDPARGLAPAPGLLRVFQPPTGPGIRVDSGVVEGMTIAPEFDSMIAKIIATGRDRAQAVARLQRALAETRVLVEDGATNMALLRELLADPDVRAGRYDTSWLDRQLAQGNLVRERTFEALVLAAIVEYRRRRHAEITSFLASVQNGIPQQAPVPEALSIDLAIGGRRQRVAVHDLGRDRYLVGPEPALHVVIAHASGDQAVALTIGGVYHEALYAHGRKGIVVELDGASHTVELATSGTVKAPAPAMVVQVAVAEGQAVAIGDRLLTLEAMKLEMPLFASEAGRVRAVLCSANQQVAAGQTLVLLEPLAEALEGDAGVAATAPGALAWPPALRTPLEGLFASGQPDLDSLDTADEAAAATVIFDLIAAMRSALLGYDVSEAFGRGIASLLGGGLDFSRLRYPQRWAGVAELLGVFADVEALFDRTVAAKGDARASSSHMRFFDFCRRQHEGEAALTPGFRARLHAALGRYGLRDATPSEATREAMLRMWMGHVHADRRHQLCSLILRAIISLHGAGVRFDPKIRGDLERIAKLADQRHSYVADNAAQAIHALFRRGRGLSGGFGAPMVLTDELAERLELWRLAAFETRRLETFAPVVAFTGFARDNPRDERVFVFAEIDAIGDGHSIGPGDLDELEAAWQEAVGVLREVQLGRTPSARLHWNRLTLAVRRTFAASEAQIAEICGRLEGSTQGLGIEKVVVRCRLRQPGSDAPPRDTAIVIGRPARHRLELSLSEPSRVPIRAISDYEMRVVGARRLGLTYPYEIARMICGDSGGGPPPHPDLVDGSFTEYDLAPDGAAHSCALVPVDRAPGGNRAGIVVGVVENRTALFPDGMARVFIASDPTMAMGALAEPECRRIAGAIDLAAALGLPIEWIAISSGAKIAMDSGTENLDWTARVLRRIVEHTAKGGVIHVLVCGVNVGAQSYWNAEATMLMHTRGLLIMTAEGSMVLTGKKALEVSGSVAAEDERGIGGYERVMGPNGQAQIFAQDLGDAYAMLMRHYRYSYRRPDEAQPRANVTQDPRDRSVLTSPYAARFGESFRTVGDIFDDAKNPGRKQPFAIREVMSAVIDQDGDHLERFAGMRHAETAVVWDAFIGGHPCSVIGFESRPMPRRGRLPMDGPDTWTGGTLFPSSSRKVARALRAASGSRPVVVLANLSGFDGSPESLRRLQLEYGAEIGRAVVEFDGVIVFVVIGRYHGGAYVVFSKALNERLVALAVEGSYASVIGGGPAAAVVFPREVKRRAELDDKVKAARAAVAEAQSADKPRVRERLMAITAEAILEHQGAVAREFDAIHTVHRAVAVGSLDAVIEAAQIRPEVIRRLDAAR